MTQTLRRERKQKFLEILSDMFPTSTVEFNKVVAGKLSDAAMSRSELSAEAEFGEQKPNIYKIYEENIGPLTPMIADELNDIEKTYPEGWFEDACKEAVKMNVRNLKYIVAILVSRKAGKTKPEKQVKQDNVQSVLEKIANGETTQ